MFRYSVLVAALCFMRDTGIKLGSFGQDVTCSNSGGQKAIMSREGVVIIKQLRSGLNRVYGDGDKAGDAWSPPGAHESFCGT